MTFTETVLVSIIALALAALLAPLISAIWRDAQDRPRGHKRASPPTGATYPRGQGAQSAVTHDTPGDMLTHHLLFHTDHNAYDGHHDSSCDSGGFDSGGFDGGGDCGGGDGGGGD